MKRFPPHLTGCPFYNSLHAMQVLLLWRQTSLGQSSGCPSPLLPAVDHSDKEMGCRYRLCCWGEGEGMCGTHDATHMDRHEV